MINNNYSAAGSNADSLSNKSNKTVLKTPNLGDVGNFQNAMSKNSSKPIDTPFSSDGAKKSGDQVGGDKMKKILMLLIQLLSTLTKSLKDGDKGSGGAEGAHSAKGGGSNPAKIQDGKIVNEKNVASGDGQIPKPTEHMQSFKLGGKQVSIGGDGSASASEVQKTKGTLTNLYNNSPSFKNMIDSSPNNKFEVSVGKRNDNMSWGNSDGRVFMNLNNIQPGSSDSFQSLTAHEFAHASKNMPHGAEMKSFEQTVAKEA